jgi:hypothetical protein
MSYSRSIPGMGSNGIARRPIGAQQHQTPTRRPGDKFGYIAQQIFRMIEDFATLTAVPSRIKPGRRRRIFSRRDSYALALTPVMTPRRP